MPSPSITLRSVLVVALASSTVGCVFIADAEHGERRDQVVGDSHVDDTAPPDPVDLDGDGYPLENDCDDGDPAVHPDADERCNGVDDDCDGDIDEDDAIDASTWFRDDDGDGFGDPDATHQACTQPSGWVQSYGDCDDANAAIHPDALEACNEVDDDCDDRIDEDPTDAPTWYSDDDADGYGDPDSERLACEQPSGMVADASDCDDLQDSVNPAATERCNGHDDDCDGQTDEDDSEDVLPWWVDVDGDGYGDSSVETTACEPPSGYAAPTAQVDCDDADATINPGASETCNGVDDDCDGTADETAVDMGTWYQDSDGDGYGDSIHSRAACDAPSGYVADGSDCVDWDAGIHPGASETCDGVDEDCDGAVDDGAIDMSTWYADADGDGYGDAGSTSSACDLPSGHSADSSDCDDGDAGVHPGASETCDGVDQDCDGTADDGAIDMDTWYGDADGDGYGDASSGSTGCSQPSGTVSDGSDCDDGDAVIHPGAAELCSGVDEDCDGALDDSGSVTFYGSSGSVASLTSSYAGGSASSALIANLAADGSVVFCDGTYYVELEVTAADLTLEGFNGSGRTTLMGDGTDTVISLNGSTSFRMNGLTVTGGDGSLGGGLYGADSGAAVSISDCAFVDNEADQGGGIYLLDANLVVADTSFDRNDAQDSGGGLYLSGGSASLDAVSVDGGSAANHGGGVYLTAASVSITDSSIDDNEAQDYGGGLYATAGDLTLTNTAVTNNSADTGGGGLMFRDSGAVVEGCTIQGNMAVDWGGGMLLSATTVDLMSSLVIDNELTGGWDALGGGALVYDGSVLTCAGSTSEDAGIYGNTAGDGGGAYLSDSADRLDSDSCDWGAGTEDNDPDDVDLGYFSSYSSFGDDETFSCIGGSSGSCL